MRSMPRCWPIWVGHYVCLPIRHQTARAKSSIFSTSGATNSWPCDNRRGCAAWRSPTRPSATGLDAHLGWLDQAIAEIEAALRELVRASADLAGAEALLRSTPGIGDVGAAVLIGLLPELGHRSAKQIAMLAGLAPVNQDSGIKRGQRSIRGGRRRVRQALYMAAVVTLRTRSPLTAFYDRLRNAGKPAKVALIALARKILVILNAMMRSRTPYAA
jgi:transposase